MLIARALLTAVLCSLFAGIVAAQAPSPLNDAAKAVLGPWDFSNADRDRRCTLTLRGETAPGGLKIELDKACTAAFAFLKEVVAWSIAENDFLRLLDAKGKPLLEFSQVEDGMYEAPRPGEGILFLQTVASLEPPPPSPEQMAGEWAVTRGNGKPICTLTLASTPAGDDFALRVKPGCDALVTRFAPSAWQMDRNELILKGAREQVWRFEANDGSTWQRVPETPNPVMLVRR